ncbi:LysR family transcriptional regulator [Leucobacter komagatae]|uniref:LysR family transcriptional regulator n=1 Tax=Leucobacter komagatae TaxID=55969 RepID=A0A0D0H2B1_9MICO|nr:LysR family transcriptional regulator [Leucobacter komagatae]KIP51275.1 LysR family transcriptional regulator [Leucobacter komagatae]
MEWSLKELRCFVAAATSGTITGAASELHVSQASASRAIAGLERALGQQVLRRGRHGCVLTAFGEALLPHARRLLAQVDTMNALAQREQHRIRLGYAWSALGKHTTNLLRQWRETDAASELHFEHHDTPTSGLAEGRCDVAIMRSPPDPLKYSSAVIGLERRVGVFSVDDPLWARRRTLRMREFAARTVAAEPRAGTTRRELWDGGPAPENFLAVSNTEDWLTTISAGEAVGVSAESTAVHHARSGVRFIPITDAPRIAVRLVWWRDEAPTGVEALVELATRLYARG